ERIGMSGAARPDAAGRTSCQDFAASVPATKGLIAAPWTPASHLLCCRERPPACGPAVPGGFHVKIEGGTQAAPRGTDLAQCDAAGVKGGNRILSHGAPPRRLMPNGCLGSPAIVLPLALTEASSWMSVLRGAPWLRFVWSCRERPDPAGRRRVKRSVYLHPKGARGQQHAEEAASGPASRADRRSRVRPRMGKAGLLEPQSQWVRSATSGKDAHTRLP